MSPENPSSPPWTYHTQVTASGQPQGVNAGVASQDPVALLNILVNLQAQQTEFSRQIHEMQRQQLELVRESTQIARDQRARQIADLERWQNSHSDEIDACKQSLARLEHVHSRLIGELTEYVEENHENLAEGDFTLSDFVDRFGPRLAHLNTMLAVLRPLAAAQKKPESS